MGLTEYAVLIFGALALIMYLLWNNARKKRASIKFELTRAQEEKEISQLEGMLNETQADFDNKYITYDTHRDLTNRILRQLKERGADPEGTEDSD